MAVESIVTVADAQYVKELEEDCIGYKKQTIKTMINQLCTWYLITTKEKLAIKAHFLMPWSDTPELHVIAFARQLDRLQVESKYHGVTVTNDNKVDHFVA